jgi:hypothetical protein
MKRFFSILLLLVLLFSLGCSAATHELATATPVVSATTEPLPTPQEGLAGLPFSFLENTFALYNIQKQPLSNGQIEYDVQFVLKTDTVSPVFSTIFDLSTDAPAMYGLRLLPQGGTPIDPYSFFFKQLTDVEGYSLLANYSYLLNADQTPPNQAEFYEFGGDASLIVELSTTNMLAQGADSAPTPTPPMSHKKKGLHYRNVYDVQKLDSVSEYDENGLITQNTPYEDGTPKSYHTEYEYKNGLLVTKTDYYKFDVTRREVFEYIWPGILTARTVYSGQNGEITESETFEYNKDFQLLSHIKSASGDSPKEHERYSYITNENGLTSQFVCQGNGYQTTTLLTWNDNKQLILSQEKTDGNLYTEAYFYEGDLLVKTISTNEEAIPDEPKNWITYTYRENGSLLEKRSHNRDYPTTDYTNWVEFYDTEGTLLLRIKYTLSGDVDEMWQLVRSYDNYGRLIREISITNGRDFNVCADYYYYNI